MATEELQARYFTRDRIRNRMIRRAAELWGFSDGEMEDFDPLVALLIEACSVEFEKLAGEIGRTQKSMLERLAHLLYPGMISSRPACCIIQARSAEPLSILYPDAQFVYKNMNRDRQSGAGQDSDEVTEFFFSPAIPTQIIDGSIRYMASACELFEVDKGLQKVPVASSRRGGPGHQHKLWLGLDIPVGASLPPNSSFFFQWINQPGDETWYPHLPYSSWSIDGIPLQQTAGLPLLTEAVSVDRLSKEFDVMGKIEEEVVQLFNRHFITLTSLVTAEQLDAVRCHYPAIFEALFDAACLKGLQQPLVWVEIAFPSLVPPEALDQLTCGINCFPALNRRLNTFSYRLQQNLNIIPLETQGTFLSIREIADSQGDAVRLIPFANPAGLPPETYTLRYGVNRFDKRIASAVLVDLLELMREESSFFSSLGQDFISQHIRELNQVLARLEEKVAVTVNASSPVPYLIVKPRKEGGNVTISYWSCNGASANKIARGAQLLAYKSSNTRGGSLLFMTASAGGRDHFSDSEKIDHYRKFLLTRNRIVTPEDLKAVVKAELGTLAAAIGFRRAFASGALPGEGFQRCIEIRIKPAASNPDITEWNFRLQELRLQFEKQSTGQLPYHLLLDLA